MNTSEAFDALRRANPRSRPGFAQSVDAAGERVRAQIVYEPAGPARRRRLRVSAAGASLAVVAVAAAAVTVGRSGSETATAAFKQAATLTAAAAERSGTADVRITHNGDEWAGSFIRWNGNDISIARARPSTWRKVGDEMRVVDGVLYGLDHRGDWLAMGSPRNIDPDSGTTPDEYLAAVREDVGGVTLQRFTHGMKGLTRTTLDNGSTVYRGTIAAGIVAPETGFKEGETLRVFPFGYVAHDEAANANSQLDIAVTVGPEGVVREIVVTWGTPASSWVYKVAYNALGTTDGPVAPANARDLLKERLRAAPVAPPTP